MLDRMSLRRSRPFAAAVLLAAIPFACEEAPPPAPVAVVVAAEPAEVPDVAAMMTRLAAALDEQSEILEAARGRRGRLLADEAPRLWEATVEEFELAAEIHEVLDTYPHWEESICAWYDRVLRAPLTRRLDVVIDGRLRGGGAVQILQAAPSMDAFRDLWQRSRGRHTVDLARRCAGGLPDGV